VSSPTRTVAAFDLDGTLVRGDTLVPFLCRARGRSRTITALLAHSPVLARALLVGRHRDRAKEMVLSQLLRHHDEVALRATAARFAEEVVARRVRGHVLERAEDHRRAGHELVIVSASPSLYVEPIGRLLDFDMVLATRLETDADGRLTGRIEGRNCRGPEKVARLREWAGTGPLDVYAYGDSTGDLELLAQAHAAFRLRRGRRGRWAIPPGPLQPASEVVVDDPGVGVGG
jgi:phosphatidylglycerophosphatase C